MMKHTRIEILLKRIAKLNHMATWQNDLYPLDRVTALLYYSTQELRDVTFGLFDENREK